MTLAMDVALDTEHAWFAHAAYLLKASQCHTGICQKSPFAVARAPGASGAKIGVSIIMHPHRQRCRGPGEAEGSEIFGSSSDRARPAALGKRSTPVIEPLVGALALHDQFVLLELPAPRVQIHFPR